MHVVPPRAQGETQDPAVIGFEADVERILDERRQIERAVAADRRAHLGVVDDDGQPRAVERAAHRARGGGRDVDHSPLSYRALAADAAFFAPSSRQQSVICRPTFCRASWPWLSLLESDVTSTFAISVNVAPTVKSLMSQPSFSSASSSREIAIPHGYSGPSVANVDG